MTGPVARFGRRGVALILIGVAWVGFGLTLLAAPPVPDADAAIFMDYIPAVWQFAAWAFTGMVAVVAGARRPWQWVGYIAATIMPILRATSFAWSTIMWLVPGAPEGDSRSVGAGLMWTALIGLVLVVGSWPDTTHLPEAAP
ncbi:MAG TPA: hypothetical protein PLK64_10250 [Dermatophilaceae bacterium]|nr:hypothetical protein [Dermatophilaceae bacterium]